MMNKNIDKAKNSKQLVKLDILKYSYKWTDSWPTKIDIYILHIYTLYTSNWKYNLKYLDALQQ